MRQPQRHTSRPASWLLAKKPSRLWFAWGSESSWPISRRQKPLSLQGVKWPWLEADHPLPSGVETKNVWSYTSSPPHVFMVCTGTTLPLTNSMEYSRPAKLPDHQLFKKFLEFSATPGFITAFKRARHMSLSWVTLIRTMPPCYVMNTCFNIILPPTPKVFQVVSFSQVSHQNPVGTSPVSYTCHIPRPSHSSWFDHANNIGWAVQIMKLLAM